MTWNCTNKVGTFKHYEDLMELTKVKGSQNGYSESIQNVDYRTTFAERESNQLCHKQIWTKLADLKAGSNETT